MKSVISKELTAISQITVIEKAVLFSQFKNPE
jgi:hypothetical protein